MSDKKQLFEQKHAMSINAAVKSKNDKSRYLKLWDQK